jgi:hypothetical protein
MWRDMFLGWATKLFYAFVNDLTKRVRNSPFEIEPALLQIIHIAS